MSPHFAWQWKLSCCRLTWSNQDISVNLGSSFFFFFKFYPHIPSLRSKFFRKLTHCHIFVWCPDVVILPASARKHNLPLWAWFFLFLHFDLCWIIHVPLVSGHWAMSFLPGPHLQICWFESSFLGKDFYWYEITFIRSFISWFLHFELEIGLPISVITKKFFALIF